MDVRVVVRAKIDHFTQEKTRKIVIDSGKRFVIKKGDLGLLNFERHEPHPDLLQPRVLWDKDPLLIFRKASWDALEIAGLQYEYGGKRILLINTTINTR